MTICHDRIPAASIRPARPRCAAPNALIAEARGDGTSFSIAQHRVSELSSTYATAAQ